MCDRGISSLLFLSSREFVRPFHFAIKRLYISFLASSSQHGFHCVMLSWRSLHHHYRKKKKKKIDHLPCISFTVTLTPTPVSSSLIRERHQLKASSKWSFTNGWESRGRLWIYLPNWKKQQQMIRKDANEKKIRVRERKRERKKEKCLWYVVYERVYHKGVSCCCSKRLLKNVI